MPRAPFAPPRADRPDCSTTEPPKLSSEHPIRRAFASYGNATARHWLFSLLLSVAVAVFLCYPVVFLYESPAAGGLPPVSRCSARDVASSTASTSGEVSASSDPAGPSRARQPVTAEVSPPSSTS